MNWDDVKENWSHARQEAKSKWSKLTQQELNQIDGNRTALMEKLVKHYSLKLEGAGLEVDRWAEDVEIT